jgi:tRNA-dihydrouridine synthase
MSCHGNNATPPSPAIAPGVEHIDPAGVARDAGRRGMDPRVLAFTPAYDAPFFQAGLAGYSDAAMRIVARRHGCPYCVTEALLDRMLLGGGHGFDKADLELIRDNIPGGAEDSPLAGQIIGSDPDEMAAAALKMIEQSERGDRYYRTLAYERTGMPEAGTDPRLRDWACVDEFTSDEPGVVHAPSPRKAVVRAAAEATGGAPTFAAIDVNLACPVKKIKNKGRGGHWLSEPEGAYQILKAVRQAVPGHIPCTVKLRRAFDDTPEMERRFNRVFDAAYELGYAWATVHARTVEQKYIGPSRWPALAELVRRYPDRPVFGSGDIWEAADIFRMIGYTGVSGVSVARGCIGNPWIFRQARQMMRGEPAAPPSVAEQRDVLREHFRISVVLNGEDAGSRMMRKFGIRFAAHHPRAEEVRLRMIGVDSMEAWEGVVREYYEADAPATLA